VVDLNTEVIRDKSNPQPAEVRELRESVQYKRGIGITAAQHLCADMLHTSQRAWRQWETGDRKMHPAFWELAQAKLKELY